MIIAFTGTRKGMTQQQHDKFAALLTTFPWEQDSEFHHGDCIGSDAQARALAQTFGFITIAHPGCTAQRKTPFRSEVPSDKNHFPAPYLERNREMVDLADVLIATPATAKESVRSGTWYTIRYARKCNKTIQLHIITP